MCKNLSNFILPRKGVSDNNAPKQIKSKGNQSELKRPLQVLQLNKKHIDNDTFKESPTNENISSNNDDSYSMQQKDFELESEKLNINSLEKEIQDKNAEQSNLSLNNIEKPKVLSEVNKVFEQERILDEYDFDEDQFLAALNENEPIGLTGETISGKIIALELSLIHI